MYITLLNCSVRKANTSATGAEKGHLLLCRHQLAHICEGPSYLFWLLAHQEANKILNTSGEKPAVCRRDLTEAIQLVGEFATLGVLLVD